MKLQLRPAPQRVEAGAPIYNSGGLLGSLDRFLKTEYHLLQPMEGGRVQFYKITFSGTCFQNVNRLVGTSIKVKGHPIQQENERRGFIASRQAQIANLSKLDFFDRNNAKKSDDYLIPV